MAQADQQTRLNLGCGLSRKLGWVNVDAHGTPDVLWDLNTTPYPWRSNTVDEIELKHVLEHLEDYWSCVEECARILKPGGWLRIHVPHDSSSTALTYRDHVRVFSPASFLGIVGHRSGNNAWAAEHEATVPLVMVNYYRVPYPRYEWMARWCPWLLEFCAEHLRNFIWEQQFHLRKVGG